MFLYCAASSVPIWSGKSILLHLGPPSVFFFGQEQTIFYIVYSWEHLQKEN